MDNDQDVKTFKYVKHHQVLDYARLGWLPHFEALADTPHGQYSVFMEWPCSCPMPRPPQSSRYANQSPDK